MVVDDEKDLIPPVEEETNEPTAPAQNDETTGAGTDLFDDPPKSDPYEEAWEKFVEESDKMKKKPVRGKMLKKLLKYDFRALFKFLLPCYIVLFALAAIGAIFLTIAEHNAENAEAAISVVVFSIFFYVFSVFACVIVCAVSIVNRYEKNLFSGEGYLTLTTPATAEEHIFSKILSAVITFTLTVVVAVSSILIIALPYAKTAFPEMLEFVKELFIAYGRAPVESTLFLIEEIIVGAVVLIFNAQAIYSCVCLGHLFTNRNRRAASVVAFVAYFVLNYAVSIFSSFYDLPEWVYESWYGVHLAHLITFLTYSALNVAAFFWQRHVLKNKVNLE